MKRFVLISASLILFYGWAFAQSTAPMQIVNASSTLQINQYFYMGNTLFFAKTQNPFLIHLDIQVAVPVKVKYSLYTYKKTFAQDGKRNYLQGLRECGCVNPIKTQADIDNDLDKIYEFSVVTETASGSRDFFWDTYTDPKFTNGQKYSVRACIHVAAHNADTGELIGIQNIYMMELYRLYSNPAINYRIDQQKDGSGKVTKETLSGQVIVAYNDSRPFKKMTALIMTEECGFGATPISVVNQGAEAVAADINNRLPGDVVAHITLTNPTVDLDYKDIKIFEWKDIKTEDGKDFVPDLAKNKMGYRLAVIIDTDEMTYTGIINGYIWDGAYAVPPVPKSYTGIEHIEITDINITSDENGFVVLCPAGVSAKNYVVYDLGGRALKTGNLSGLSRETITANELRSSIYFVQLTIKENGEEKVVTKKVIIQ